MTVEKLETNDNPTPEAEKPPATPTRAKTTTRAGAKEKEVVALSVKEHDEAGHLKVVSTYTSVGGQRPVTASGMEVSGTLTISGNRPIAVSHLNISETYTVMGNRPVASNEIDDAEALMGFLD
ncbi:MAG: hypothetical protein RLZZ148_2218 [Cyanobacteriota bacterium]